MLMNTFAGPFQIDGADVGSIYPMVDLDASATSRDEEVFSDNKTFDTVSPLTFELPAISSADDVKEGFYITDLGVPSVLPLQLSATFGDANSWSVVTVTDSGQEWQPTQSHMLKQENLSFCGSFGLSSTFPGDQSARANLFSPSTASEASLATNDDWFALLDLGDGVDFTFDEMPGGQSMQAPLNGLSFEVLPSPGQQVPLSSTCGNLQASNQYAAASSTVYEASVASPALSPYHMGLCPASQQSDGTGLYLDSAALAEVNSLAFPVVSTTSSPVTTTGMASDKDNTRKQSSIALYDTMSITSRKEAKWAPQQSRTAKNLAAKRMPSTFQHDSVSSDGDAIVVEPASQPFSSGMRGESPVNNVAVPLNDASHISGGPLGAVPKKKSTGREQGTAKPKPPPKRRSKSKAGPRLTCHQPGCGKTFSSQHNLNEHQQVHEYPRVQRYFCREDQCALEVKGFNFKRDRMRHYRQKHPWVAERLKEEAARQVQERRAALERKKAEMAAIRAAARERVAAVRKAQKIRFKLEKEANGNWSGTVDCEMQVIDGQRC
ncbi:hypothetical protein PHSY_003910 [Pseudozyma hubeiensis SY62]|uniref:C2H2-type domain-containing protein n=1 Tax=Pseudozyma hubeiensis (strain SY62) TaxID=1305764 RepID=R9PE40_PSEHS|nr:hypothetical protein PHSY_003910 [Pseudozyma hubeiensis SY62]GAC96330.1 hypothetical protein PHSY_003910 [Pseudozyma hubeiensis SY62]